MENNKLNIQWFPGHMTKAKRGMQEKLKMVDMVIEIRDARIPMASANPMIEQLINQKPRLIILSKIDKADDEETKKWMKKLTNDTTTVIALDVLHDNINKKVIQECQKVMQAKIERQIRKGMKPRAIRSMVCGIPNVGKSTFINRMAKKKTLITGDRPGVTKSLSWVKASKELELLDTPGVLWPKFDDEQVGMLLAITGAIKDQVLPLEEVAYYALKFLKQHHPEMIIERYDVDIIENNYKLFLSIGTKKGLITKNNEVDYTRVIETFMKDIRDCKLGKITWELSDE